MLLIDRLPMSVRVRSLSALASLALLGLLSLLCAGCQTTAQKTRPQNSDDVDRSVTLPCTLANVWYRPQTNTEFAIPFTDSGSLAVTADTILFTSKGDTIRIPVTAVTNVSWRKMVGDRENEWAVVYWTEDGVDKVAGFTAANGYRFDTSNMQLYSALVVAWQPQPPR